MSAANEDFIPQCTTCAHIRPNPVEPMQPSTFPGLRWDKIACELFETKGKRYLVVADYFSRFIEVAAMRSTTADAATQGLSAMFSTHGIPRTVMSDNGPQFFGSTFRAFTADHGIVHCTSKPGYTQNNGEAECAVQIAKKLLATNDDLQAALLAYQSTPLSHGYSPAQLLFSCKLRTKIPAPLQPPAWPDLNRLRQQENAAKKTMTENYNLRHCTRPLPALDPGTPVYIPDHDTDAQVVKQIY